MICPHCPKKHCCEADYIVQDMVKAYWVMVVQWFAKWLHSKRGGTGGGVDVDTHPVSSGNRHEKYGTGSQE